MILTLRRDNCTLRDVMRCEDVKLQTMVRVHIIQMMVYAGDDNIE